MISPEGCASILWRNGENAKDAAEALRLTAQEMLRLGVIDQIVAEPLGGAHRAPREAIAKLGEAIEEALRPLAGLDGETLRRQRRQKFLAMGKRIIPLIAAQIKELLRQNVQSILGIAPVIAVPVLVRARVIMTFAVPSLVFLRSREGNGWAGILLFSAALSFAAAFGLYQASLKSFVASKIDEKLTAMQLVDAFVGDYAKLRGSLDGDRAPAAPAFRAQSLASFNQSRTTCKSVLRLRWVDRDEGKRDRRAGPADPAMAHIIELCRYSPSSVPVSQFLTNDGVRVFRTVYPAIRSRGRQRPDRRIRDRCADRAVPQRRSNGNVSSSARSSSG